MPRTAIITGIDFSEELMKGFEQQIVKTMYGNVILFVKEKNVILFRHGKNHNIPPQRINHKANILALNLQGVERIVGIESVKSLNPKVKPGEYLIPEDYIDFSPESFFEMEIRNIKPEFHSDAIKGLIAVAKKLKIPLKNKGVYLQLKGARQETAAEINVIKSWADIVGTSIASEATFSKELALPYAGLCIVGQYAQGITVPKSKSPNKTQKGDSIKIEKIVKEIFARSAK